MLWVTVRNKSNYLFVHCLAIIHHGVDRDGVQCGGVPYPQKSMNLSSHKPELPRFKWMYQIIQDLQGLYSWIFLFLREPDKSIPHKTDCLFLTIHPSFWFVDRFWSFEGWSFSKSFKKKSIEKIGTPTFLNIDFFLKTSSFRNQNHIFHREKVAQNIPNVCLGVGK